MGWTGRGAGQLRYHRGLRGRLDAPGAPLLVNVLPPEAFAARQIAGSCNPCVYEVGFLDQMAALAPRDRAVVVHGAGGASQDAATAAGKLAAAGWSDVTVFADGLGEGTVVFAAGTPVAARIAIDMRAIACDDLAGHPSHDYLIQHLQNDDFFDVAHHPEAVFEAGALTPCQPARDGHPCYAHDLDGRFTLRGVTQPLQVPVTLGSAGGDEGSRL